MKDSFLSETEHVTADSNWLKEKYFSNSNQKLLLKKDDIILNQGQENDRIYYLQYGELSGNFMLDDGENMQLFTIKPHMLAGIYSFFSPGGQSYTTVKAEMESEVYFVTKSELPIVDDPAYSVFLKKMLPVIVDEIYFRQMLLMQSAKEKQQAMKKLFHAEKLATLGQLAAGLAHELNNAIGVIQNKTIWLSAQLKEHFQSSLDSNLYRYFDLGLKSAKSFSSSEIRERKKRLQLKIDMDDKTAKQLARIELSDVEIDLIAKRGNKHYIEQVDQFWELGQVLHDMGIAAEHTNYVIKSIKELGAQDHNNVQSCDLNTSISKALTLVQSLTTNITIESHLQPDLILQANEGKLIQVWVNLIKNAAESLTQANTTDPKITITTKSLSKEYQVAITDNGPGIAADVLPNIFQPNVTTKVTGMSFGLGLGLSITQRIITALNGNIAVTSVAGKTTFKITIPKQ